MFPNNINITFIEFSLEEVGDKTTVTGYPIKVIAWQTSVKLLQILLNLLTHFILFTLPGFELSTLGSASRDLYFRSMLNYVNIYHFEHYYLDYALLIFSAVIYAYY